METSIKRLGRTGGRDYPVVKQVRLGTQDAEDLSALAREWQCTQAAAIRRAIQEKAREAGAPGADTRERQPLRKRVTPEQLRRAAESARDYYATDPEAREWADFPGDQPAYDEG